MLLQIISIVISNERKAEQECTFIKAHGPLSFEEDVDRCFLALYLAAYIIHSFQKAHVGLHELELAIGVKLLALFDYTIGGLLRATDDVGSRLPSILSKCFHCVFANATGPSHEDGYKILREGGGNVLVRRKDLCECDHLLFRIDLETQFLDRDRQVGFMMRFIFADKAILTLEAGIIALK